ncbi:M20 family metallo-hydrolase [Oceanobacillus polygoni]|uniref:N-carbamoyl-L-amino-acid hydrolase n=1 Tax=Oceanobacillus polygoni TaxID=1235259 RepID=A0A9X0YU23_9BACI|nr:M20 family metallo-hydrolase [Oceanobacillus polygoni]MBP2078842.1 N-carbamoyl-L-amino-acid hydrolase [Oceanobacillus polygoni]
MVRPDGFTRLSFTKEEKAAHLQFENIAAEIGLKTRQDAAGNYWAIWEVDQTAPTIAMGSHLDTVNCGGGYDGAAGVLTALAAIKGLQDMKFQPEKNIAVICFVSEESARFGVSTIGSKAITAQLNRREIETIKDRNGITIKQAMTDYGLDWESIEEAALPIDSLESFIELHIEQGMELQETGAEIGIVKGIACPVRLTINTKGMANHTGTTLMNRRKDALVAIAPLINYVQEEALKVNESSEFPLVATVSTIRLHPNAMNVIPGEVELGIDIRSVDDKLKRNFVERIRSFVSELEAKNQVTIEIKTLVDHDSIMLDGKMHARLKQVSEALGYETLSMNSGAGHDVMNMAVNWPAGLIFIPSKDGVSHHPTEFASLESLEKGTNVIMKYIEQEAGNAHES